MEWELGWTEGDKRGSMGYDEGIEFAFFFFF